MGKNEDSKAISKVELILPANVVEACWNLKKNNQAYFFAVNEQDKTSSEINIHKLADSSVKIRVTVFPLNAEDQKEDDDDPDDSFDPDESGAGGDDTFGSPPRGGGSARRQPKKSGAQEWPSKSGGGPTDREAGMSPPLKRYGTRNKAPGAGGNADSAKVAAAVNKMKSVLTPNKKADAVMHVVQPDEDEEDYTAEDENEAEPQASTIIIVKGPKNFDGQDDDDTPGSAEKAKKSAPRVHTMTVAGGKQIVYKGKKVKVEKEEGKEESEEEGGIDDGEKPKKIAKKSGEGQESPEEKATPAKKGKKSLSQPWKSAGVESKELESGDVIIDADDLKMATDTFSVTVNDTAYNFDGNETTPSTQTSKVFDSEKKPHRLSQLIGTPVQKVNCMVCGKILQNYSYLFRHVKQFHRDIDDIEQYLDEIRPMMKTPCPICGKLISSVSNMSSHIVQCHPVTPENYSCTICGGDYKTRISLKHHMQSQHSDNRRRYPCSYCGNTFTEVRSLKEHVNCTHETTEVFCCEVCSKTFLTRGRLRRHMYIHGEYRLFCKMCGKGFHLKDNMNKHIELMHEKKFEGRFKCEYCNKAFSVKGNLQQHVNAVHLKTLPYRCPICDEGFRKKGVMLSHMKSHSVAVNADADNSAISAASMESGLDETGDESKMDDDTMGDETMDSTKEKEEEEELDEEEEELDEEELKAIKGEDPEPVADTAVTA